MPRLVPRLDVKPVDLGGEIGVEIPAAWICRPLEPGRWWCGEAASRGPGVILLQELTDPCRSEPGRPPTPLANADHRADQIRAAVEARHPGVAVTDRPTLSGRLLQIGTRPPRRARQGAGEVRWAAVEGYSTAASVFHVALDLPTRLAGQPVAEQLVAHFAGQAALGNRCPPRAAGRLRQRDLRIGDAAVLGVPAEWRCRPEGEAIRCEFGGGATLLIRSHAWPKAALLGQLDPPPPARLPRNALAALVADHFRASLPDHLETAPVELTTHGALLAARDPLPGAGGPAADKLFWIYALIGTGGIVGIWFTLFLPAGAVGEAAMADRIADCIRGLRPAGGRLSVP
ncbi:MAG: hypothetical protein U1E53_17080 [Dongiaceae bacterium]